MNKYDKLLEYLKNNQITWLITGAGAVVNKDIPAYALMAGVPAKQIGWMSEHGEKLDLPVLGSAETICKHSGRKYILENNKLTVNNK